MNLVMLLTGLMQIASGAYAGYQGSWKIAGASALYGLGTCILSMVRA